MKDQSLRKKFITLVVLIFTFTTLSSVPFVLAQDTAKLVYDRCTECHTESRWKNKKKTRKQWADDVNKMVMWGARLTDDESTLVIEYLTAMSNGNIKQPTTTTTQKKATTSSTTSTTVVKAAAVSTTTSTTTPATTSTTVLGASTSIITQQAQTGVEMIWYLLGGGMMVGSGMAMRNREKQLRK